MKELNSNYPLRPKWFLIFIHIKTCCMKKETHDFQFTEGVRNAIIVFAIFSIIALISYFEWKGRLGH